MNHLDKQPYPACGEVFLDSIEEIPQPCLRDKGHPGSHRIRPDDDLLAAIKERPDHA